MTSFEFINFNTIPIAIGALIMTLAALQVNRILSIVKSGRYRAQWSTLYVLMIFFIIAYLLSIYVISMQNLKFVATLSSIVFLFGSIFVHLVVSTSLKTLEILEEKRADSELALNLERQKNELTAINIALHQENEDRINLVYDLSHDFRTPLNSIIGFTELLELQYAANLDKKQKEYLESINKSSHQLLHLIDKLLTYAKHDHRDDELNLECVQVDNEIEDLVTSMMPIASEKNISISIDFQISKDLINVDLRIFRRVILNLLSNAIKYTPEHGNIGVVVKHDDMELKVSIIDRGCGVPEAYRKKIFEPYFQVDLERDETLNGTGLGLSVCKKIVELHGGHIGVEANIGGGSIFWFSIPQSKEVLPQNLPAKRLDMPTL